MTNPFYYYPNYWNLRTDSSPTELYNIPVYNLGNSKMVLSLLCVYDNN